MLSELSLAVASDPLAQDEFFEMAILGLVSVSQMCGCDDRNLAVDAIELIEGSEVVLLKLAG
jgi:hypothetical protein